MGEVMVTTSEALPLPLLAVAVTVQWPGPKPAVKSPEVEIDPQLAFHADATLDRNCTPAPSITVGLEGETVIARRVAAHSRRAAAGKPNFTHNFAQNFTQGQKGGIRTSVVRV